MCAVEQREVRGRYMYDGRLLLVGVSTKGEQGSAQSASLTAPSRLYHADIDMSPTRSTSIMRSSVKPSSGLRSIMYDCATDATSHDVHTLSHTVTPPSRRHTTARENLER